MLRRKRRGTLAQELGKTTGGVLAAMGSFACCQAMLDPALEHLLAFKWTGLLLAIGGSVVRLMSYWRITAPKEEQ